MFLQSWSEFYRGADLIADVHAIPAHGLFHFIFGWVHRRRFRQIKSETRHFGRRTDITWNSVKLITSDLTSVISLNELFSCQSYKFESQSFTDKYKRTITDTNWQANRFCDESNHDPTAPNKHNYWCRNRSVKTIVKESRDMFDLDPLSPTTETKPTFNYVTRASPVVYVVIDVATHDGMDKVRCTFQLNDRYQLLYEKDCCLDWIYSSMNHSDVFFLTMIESNLWRQMIACSFIHLKLILNQSKWFLIRVCLKRWSISWTRY